MVSASAVGGVERGEFAIKRTPPPWVEPSLLHRNTLREVPGFIDRSAEVAGDVVGEELAVDVGEQRLDEAELANVERGVDERLGRRARGEPDDRRAWDCGSPFQSVSMEGTGLEGPSCC